MAVAQSVEFVCGLRAMEFVYESCSNKTHFLLQPFSILLREQKKAKYKNGFHPNVYHKCFG
jgi:hypothetical protein